MTLKRLLHLYCVLSLYSEAQLELFLLFSSFSKILYPSVQSLLCDWNRKEFYLTLSQTNWNVYQTISEPTKAWIDTRNETKAFHKLYSALHRFNHFCMFTLLYLHLRNEYLECSFLDNHSILFNQCHIQIFS